MTVPSASQYTLLVDPLTMALGSVTLTLYNVAADISGSITPGTALPLSITVPGTNAQFTFDGTAGQRISLTGTGTISGHIGFGCDVWVGIVKPDTYQLTSTCMEGGGFIDATTLPTPETYTVVVDPQTTATGGLTLTLYQVNDATGTLAINGGTVGVTISAPGQNAALTFSGTQSQLATVRLTGNTLLYPTVSLMKPDGSTLYSMWSAQPTSTCPHKRCRRRGGVPRIQWTVVLASAAEVDAHMATMPPYILGNVEAEKTTVGTQSFSRSWTYEDATGFLTDQTTYGLHSTFTRDGLGNVASVTTPSRKGTVQCDIYGYR